MSFRRGTRTKYTLVSPFKKIEGSCFWFPFVFLFSWVFCCALIRLVFADIRDEVLDLKFSPDGTRLATCSRDMSILVYAIEDMPRHDTEEEEEGESDDQDGGTHRKPRAAVDGSGIHSTVRTAGDQNEAGGASGSGGGSNSGGGGRSRFDGTHENREEMLHPLQYGRLGIRLIHRLRRSATASVCRIFW